jgi:hypothetical protein
MESPEDKTADSGVAAFGSSADAARFVDRTAKKRGGSGSSGAGRWPDREWDERPNAAERGKKFLLEDNRPHNDIEDITAEGAMFGLRTRAHLFQFLLRAVNQERGAVSHEADNIK